LFALVLVAYISVLAPTRRVKGRAVLLLATGLAFSVLLLMPSVVRYGVMAPAREDFSQHFVYPFQLLSASWGYGVSTPDWGDGLPLQLGLAATGLTLVTGMLLVGGYDGGPAVRRRAGFFVAAAIVLALSLLYPASFLWQVTGAALLLKYPWQLLAFAGLAMSLAAGAVVGFVGRLAGFRWQVVLTTLVILASYEYLSPRFIDVRVAGSPVTILEDKAALLSYRREGPLLHGATVRLILNWQSLRPMETDYTVFVHIVDQEGAIWGQRDAMPQDGERPTSSWALGEIVEDQYELQIDVEGPRNGYALELGMYDPGTGERLQGLQGDTVVILE
jgi:hypothetical protein